MPKSWIVKIRALDFMIHTKVMDCTPLIILPLINVWDSNPDYALYSRNIFAAFWILTLTLIIHINVLYWSQASQLSHSHLNGTVNKLVFTS